MSPFRFYLPIDNRGSSAIAMGKQLKAVTLTHGSSSWSAGLANPPAIPRW